ncbi:NYN domain-containing protein [Yeosuana sp.]|uniref:NYN domain-containing protein n=1 Tax=Yeosuana sp. TaxID=2529388 RepID=UPI004055008D|tara:strand:+ start:1742 stop:2485 length:744 start_codon:yes stop_codon:yes gene_type:complete
MIKDIKIAVLIDGDNIPSKYITEMMEEIAKYGTPTIKRIYGDWTKPHLAKWKTVLLENAISPIQQYSYTTGKNATDSAMIIDAMDILYSNKVDAFCLASSDSDFTKLATRLREAGLQVYGIGEKKTPDPFIVACDKFIYLEILNTFSEKQEQGGGKVKKDNLYNITPKVISMLKNSVSDAADDDGWAFLGDVGSLILKKQPNFDARNFGFEKLTPLFKSLDNFEMEQRDQSNGRFKLIYVRNKQAKR